MRPTTHWKEVWLHIPSKFAHDCLVSLPELVSFVFCVLCESITGNTVNHVLLLLSTCPVMALGILDALGLLVSVHAVSSRVHLHQLEAQLHEEARRLSRSNPKRDEALQSWSDAVEVSRCSMLLRSRLRSGPVVDMGGASMITAWLLREAKIVISIGSGTLTSRLAGRPGFIELDSSTPLGALLSTLYQIRQEPALFLQATLLLGLEKARGDLGGLSSSLRGRFPELPVLGSLLTDQGQEVPHWILPSFVAPLLQSSNNMMVELPCWAVGGCPQAQRPLLVLVMIVKNEARKIRETVESTRGAIDSAVILDTGSSDSTQQILRRTCGSAGIPLEIYEEDFVDFATTRNRVLQLAGNRTEFVLMLSGDETLANPHELRTFVRQRSGYCGSTEDVFNLRVFMGPKAWYWSERLLRGDNHAKPGWPRAENSTWRYVGVTHEAYINPTRTLSNNLFINYVGDTDNSQLQPLLDEVPGSFWISHDAQRTVEESQMRLRQDVQLLEAYLDQSEGYSDRWQHTRAIFYLAQSHRSLNNLDVAKELWERYLAADLALWRQFSYLRYGAHLGLGHVCTQARHLFGNEADRCSHHFLEAHRLCPRAEPLVYLALTLPDGSQERLDVLQKAEGVIHLEASSGHCAIYAEPALYHEIRPMLSKERAKMREKTKQRADSSSKLQRCISLAAITDEPRTIAGATASCQSLKLTTRCSTSAVGICIEPHGSWLNLVVGWPGTQPRRSTAKNVMASNWNLALPVCSMGTFCDCHRQGMCAVHACFEGQALASLLS